MDVQSQPAKDYYADGGQPYLYPAAGDPLPPRAARVLLLTKYGSCIQGHWGANESGFFVAWLPLPKRDAEKEAALRMRG